MQLMSFTPIKILPHIINNNYVADFTLSWGSRVATLLPVVLEATNRRLDKAGEEKRAVRRQ